MPAAIAAPVETEEDERFSSNVLQCVSLAEKCVAHNENRYFTRLLRLTAAVRPLLTPIRLDNVVQTYLKRKKPTELTKMLNQLVNTDRMQIDERGKETIPEQEMYIAYLCLLYLYDTNNHAKGQQLAELLAVQVKQTNRRSLDQVAARIYFYLGRFYELSGQSHQLRPRLHQMLRTAVLRQDIECTATLINLLLRGLISSNLFDQAEKLFTKNVFPEYASNNQTARFMYYRGHIHAIHLDYSGSYKYLQIALRKSPQTPKATGFLTAVTKLLVLVQLLIGEIPDRASFRTPLLRKSLMPYKQLVLAVRHGDLAQFQRTLATFHSQFAKDKTLTLIHRLRHNVIKMGVRLISLAYSKISLRDVCIKLSLESEEDAEYIVGKAVKDNAIEGIIDHEKGHLCSRDTCDVYSTREPIACFDQRISFCLDLHNESVKAMRYPNNVHRKVFNDSDEIRELEKELQHHLEEEEEF